MSLGRRAIPVLVAGAFLLTLPAAFAGTPAENSAAAATLEPLVKTKFKKVAPKLVLGKVTCVTLKDGVTANCRAHFTYAPAHANVVYTIKATLQDVGGGKLTWTTTGHSCSDQKTGKSVAC